ncbi:unnamed protein product [Leptidea sinapis]|uniref:Uncharacterized protein n=1 Tax=Leptidea sinapis TaxID=189913 RepID=A0A5E4QGH3_9NEOP|nr:unnamed protein product [Leptidea sinapis]
MDFVTSSASLPLALESVWVSASKPLLQEVVLLWASFYPFAKFQYYFFRLVFLWLLYRFGYRLQNHFFSRLLCFGLPFTLSPSYFLYFDFFKLCLFLNRFQYNFFRFFFWLLYRFGYRLQNHFFSSLLLFGFPLTFSPSYFLCFYLFNLCLFLHRFQFNFVRFFFF